MAALVIPALQQGGKLATRYLPQIMKRVQKELPQVWNKVEEYTGKSGTSMTSIAAKAQKGPNGDKYLAQASLEILMKNGVTPDFIYNVAPAFPLDQLKQLQMQFHDLDKVEQKVADTKAVEIEGDPDTILAHDNNQIVRLCRQLGISSNSLADLCAFIHTRGPAQIARYQKFENMHGRRPV